MVTDSFVAFGRLCKVRRNRHILPFQTSEAGSMPCQKEKSRKESL